MSKLPEEGGETGANTKRSNTVQAVREDTVRFVILPEAGEGEAAKGRARGSMHIGADFIVTTNKSAERYK